MESAARVYVIT